MTASILPIESPVSSRERSSSRASREGAATALPLGTGERALRERRRLERGVGFLELPRPGERSWGADLECAAEDEDAAAVVAAEDVSATRRDDPARVWRIEAAVWP